MLAKTRYFGPALFGFLDDLRQNNDRTWFAANKSRYEAEVRTPMLQFIADFGARLDKISPHFVADPRPVGGSLFRIYRDTRFAKDKTPYKTAASAHFRHDRAKDVHTPGFYLHLEPGQIFAGAGIWHPDSKTLGKIRDGIVADPDRWRGILSSKKFTAHHRISGDKLKRPPRGYDPDHPLIEDLKYKDFVAIRDFGQADAGKANFMDAFVDSCTTAAPLVRFIAESLDLEW